MHDRSLNVPFIALDASAIAASTALNGESAQVNTNADSTPSHVSRSQLDSATRDRIHEPSPSPCPDESSSSEDESSVLRQSLTCPLSVHRNPSQMIGTAATCVAPPSSSKTANCVSAGTPDSVEDDALTRPSPPWPHVGVIHHSLHRAAARNLSQLRRRARRTTCLSRRMRRSLSGSSSSTEWVLRNPRIAPSTFVVSG